MTEPTRELPQPPEKPYLAWAAIAAGFVALLAGIVLATLHVLGWLINGVSVQYPTAALFHDIGLGYPSVSWVGVQRIIDWIMACSAAGVLFISGGVLAGLGSASTEDYDKRLRDFQSKETFRKIEEERNERNAEKEARERRAAETRARRDTERAGEGV